MKQMLQNKMGNPPNSHVGEPANKGRGDPSTSKLNSDNGNSQHPWLNQFASYLQMKSF